MTLGAAPRRGVQSRRRPALSGLSGLRGYLDFFKTRSFLYNTAGMAMATFATGAYGAWGLIFYQRVHGLSSTQAASTIGPLLVVASFIGIALGTFLADILYKYTKRAYLLLAAFAVMAAIPLGAIGILDPVYRSSLVFLFGASLLMSMVLGPCNTVTANVVPASRRACRVRRVHFFDASLRRHQLAGHARLDFRPVRQAERRRLVDRQVLRVDRRRAGR